MRAPFILPALLSTTRRERLFSFSYAIFTLVLGSVILLMLMQSGHAQTANPPATTPPANTINLGTEIGPWLSGLAGVLSAFLIAVLTWATALINSKLNLDKNQAALDLEAKMRDLLQSALTNAAGQVVAMAGSKLDGMTLDLKNPLIVEAVQFVNRAAGDALAHFGIDLSTQAGQQSIATYIAGKIGLLTASNPTVAPTAPAQTPAAVALQKAS